MFFIIEDSKNATFKIMDGHFNIFRHFILMG